jgi:hypothetical protein
MTAQFRRVAKCNGCGKEVPLEDEMGQWIRLHPALDSGRGFAFMDKDIVVHRWRTDHGREFQCVMFVEVKSRGADLSESQRDTMLIVNQLFRNDRTTPTKKSRQHAGSISSTVYSSMRKTHVKVKALGYHALRMSGGTPDDSEKIVWDKREITADVLVKLLKFELHPDTLLPMDFRIHHAPGVQLKMV